MYCNALAGEYVTTPQKPVVFEVRMKRCKEKRTMGPKNINWWKCKENVGERRYIEKQEPRMVDGRGGEGSGGEAGSMEDDRMHYIRGE